MCVSDEIIYMTERNYQDSFSYEIPITNEGKYTLILKFAEVFHKYKEKKQ